MVRNKINQTDYGYKCNIALRELNDKQRGLFIEY